MEHIKSTRKDLKSIHINLITTYIQWNT